MKLIGFAFNSGRIDFTREENPWAFDRVDSGMRQSQRDRIRVDPAQAEIELRSAPVNEDGPPDWLETMQRQMQAADSLYLQSKSGVLRFRQSSLADGRERTFVTLGNQDEFNSFANQHWQRIRYLYAQRRESAFCFDIQTLISHRANHDAATRRIEIDARMDLTHPETGQQITFDATGSNASVDIIEWRGTVKEGEIGRYSPEDCHLEVSVRNVTQPMTILVEDRSEFQSKAYTFTGDKMKRLERVVERSLKQRAELASDSLESAS